MNPATILMIGASMAGENAGPYRRWEKSKSERDGVIPDKTIARRGRRQLKRMKAALSGGFIPRPTAEPLLVAPESTRPERRRAELGRA